MSNVFVGMTTVEKSRGLREAEQLWKMTGRMTTWAFEHMTSGERIDIMQRIKPWQREVDNG
jgi:hypothetical protein